MKGDCMEMKGVQVIIYDNNGEMFFLILRRVEGWHGWEFPKTLIHEGETEEQAVARLVEYPRLFSWPPCSFLFGLLDLDEKGCP